MVKTLWFHCRECGFDPWSGNYDPSCHAVRPKKKRKRERAERRACSPVRREEHVRMEDLNGGCSVWSRESNEVRGGW